LADYVDAIAARDDVEESKPNPEHAFHLLRLLGVSVEEALLVGDHWLDAECASRAGIRFVLFRRPDQDVQASQVHGYQAIGNMTEIVDVVRRSSCP